MFLGPFGVNRLVIWVFWWFKAIKAKKAAPLAGKAKCHICKSNVLKWLSKHPYEIIILPKRPVMLCRGHTSLSKAKMCHEGQKISRWKNTLKPIFVTFLKPFNLTFVKFFLLSNFWPSWHILAFERLVWPLQSITGLFGSIIIPYGCFESHFKTFDLQIWHLAFPAIGAAFLAFMALKHQNTQITNSLTPNGPKNMKKSLIFLILTHWPLQWPLWPLLAFFGL